VIVQLIGLPCSGKSTVIKSLNIPYVKLDIRDFQGFRRENKLIKHLYNIYDSKKLYIIESACGIDIANSTIIALEISKELLQQRIIKRGFKITENNKSLLLNNMIPYQYKVNSFYCSSLIEHLWLDYRELLNAKQQAQKNRSN
jgi:broad-specificity NMP kinase